MEATTTERHSVTYIEHQCRSALNRVKGMPFSWTLNPYTGCAHRCTFCYVRAFEARADRPSDDRYGRVIRVKSNVADVLRVELGRRSWKREEVVVGTATDPYQPAEGHYRLTRACLVELGHARTPFTIITRGPLVWRDVEILQEAARRAAVSVTVSVPTLDDRIWRTTEPGTAPPRRRLAIVSRLADAGIQTSVALAPLIPGLSDAPAQLEATVRAAREAGAHHIWANMLNLRPGTREHFLDALERDWPSECERLQRLFAGRSYLPERETLAARHRVRELATEPGRELSPTLRPAPIPKQLTLV